MIGIVIVAALLIVGGLMLLGNQSSSDRVSEPVDISQFPALGDVNAPVTLIEFSDYG